MPACRVNALPVEPVRPVVDVHGQFRSEASGLALPVSHQRHRAQHQRRAQWRRAVGRRPECPTGAASSGVASAPGTLVDQQREKLGRLPEAHVVGQAGPETELAQEGEPAEPPFLIGAELAGESVGGRNGLELRSSAPASRSPSQPSAATSTTGRSPGPCSSPSADRRTSPADMTSPVAPRFPTAVMAAERSSSCSSTHWPRTRTSGCFSRASWRSSVSPSVSSPSTASQRMSHSPSRPMAPVEVPPFELVRALSRSPSLLLDERHHGGASTPNPASSRRGARRGGTSGCPRRRSLVGGRRRRGQDPSEGTRRAAWPRPRRRCSSG